MFLADVAAPAAGADLLGPLLLLAGFIVVYGLAQSVDAFVKAVFGLVESLFSVVPFVNALLGGPLHSAEQAVTNRLGSFIANMEAHIATQWHHLARYIERLWAYQVGVAENLWHLVQLVNHYVSFSELSKLLHRFESHVTHLTRTINHELTRVIHRAEVKVESVAQGVYPRIRTLEHEVTKTIPREIKSARALAREAEDGVARLWDRVRALPTTAEVTAAIAAAIAALGLSGLDLLKCSEAGSLFSRRGCGLWNLLDDALGLFFDALVVASICEVIPLLEEAFSAIASPLIGELAAAGAGLCNPGDAQAPQLAVPQLALPPNPGVTLSLP